MLGVVNLDKPVGPTSHDMVGLLRRLSGTRRIGHAGTLDPLASGVLPILVGAVTRFSEELTGGPKRYLATIRLGQISATDDAEGPITPVEAPLPGGETVEEALRGFIGTIQQRPPAFSARKVGGQTAHRAARAGTPIDLPARTVEVHEMTMLRTLSGDGWLDVEIDLRCAAGTYVRSIARDLGERLGCGGHLVALRRTEAAGLRVAEAITPAALEALAEAGRLADAVRPVAELLPLPEAVLDADAAWRFVHGATQPVGAGAEGRVKVLDDARRLLGIGSVAAGTLVPAKVLPPEAPP